MASSPSPSSARRSPSPSPSATSTGSSSSFLFPQTFTTDGPTGTDVPPLPSPPGGGAGGGGGGSGNPQPGIQGSAQLYLYTFLATLILLLGVSSAIVARSLLLRRRHRRMIAEAIANGTWQPPAPRVRVDLRRKPRLWDAHVAPPLADAAQAGDRAWAGVVPFAASYIPPPSLAAATTTTTTSPGVSGTSTPAVLSTVPSTTALPLSLEQPRVRVAVLIAMPTPALFPSLAPSPSSAAPQTGWPAPFSHVGPDGRPVDEDDVLLPPLQVGIVSVGVVPAQDGDADGEGAAGKRDSEEGQEQERREEEEAR
ncbi:hypothetical protein MIND_00392700 [Mycena indigotica]|uniref:Uncharacterized protein n=1 Tax=Mycena indigotica TaxID=2126181 RepID=A0A8H6T362_9AGAR|nr:uncharacterized protein MIND_00392700 [Mycena indigotica]KAF7310191.1 hypothetical protein MIND_00392700 [Mycena indigotica]